MIKDILRILFGTTPAKCQAYIRILRSSSTTGHLKIATYCCNRLKSHGVHISPHARIGNNVKFPHPIAIVIGEGVVIEDDVRIYQSVTLGGASVGDWQSGNYP